jgi:hypothetical protein
MPTRPLGLALLGFAVERIDPAKDERYYVHGFKVFPSIVPQPDQNTYVTTYVHPIQSLVWDDFTAEPGHDYTYVFHPLAGTPKKLDRSRPSVSIDIRTEPLYGETHDVCCRTVGGCLETDASGWSRVALIDPVGGPPYRNFANEGGAWVTSRRGSDRLGVVLAGVISNLLGEVGH